VTQGFIKLAESDRQSAETINLGSGEGISIGELAAKILEMMGCKRELWADEQRVRPPPRVRGLLICDNSKAFKLAGWKPVVFTQTGVLPQLLISSPGTASLQN